MIYNYHTHTVRCHHAVDSDEEYIKCAIEAGIKYLGFSDHIPFAFPDGHESFYRVDMAEAEDYVNSLRNLAKKYKQEIQINVGFEMEYYPSYFADMLNIARKFRADYIILGQHYIDDEWPDGIPSGRWTDNEKHLTTYVNNVIYAIESGVFTYVAHPDIIHYEGNDEIYYREIKRLCEAAKAHNTPLEINMLGLRYGKHYPCDRFWRIAGEVGTPVTIGYDAHDSQFLKNTEQLKYAADIIKRYNLNYIGMPRLKRIC